MSDDINNLDPNDEGLKGIFGDRFHDATKESLPSVNAVNPERKTVNAKWEPEKPDPSAMDKLKACAKSALLYGGLSFLIFYWNQADLMASSIAVPAMCVCTALAGLGVGKNIQR